LVRTFPTPFAGEVLLAIAMSQNPVTKAIGPGSTHTSSSLYDRMGGETKLEAVVDGVYKLMKNDREIGKQFARFRLERLKDRTVDYLRGEFGGPPYKGSDLWISHSHMGINNHWYDIMMKYYVQMLKKQRIGKQETKEILESLEKMRAPIVDPGLKFKNMYLRHCEKEAAKVGGDGWGKVAATEKERQAKELETLAGLVTKQTDPKEQADASPERAQLPSNLSSPKSSRANSPRRSPPRPKARNAHDTDWRQFAFNPATDGPPDQLPSSLPSGSELLYRLSNPPLRLRTGPAFETVTETACTVGCP